jgi:hypothetical protein
MKAMIEQLAFYSALPEACPVCGGHIGFSYREPKDYKYWGLVCTEGHAISFGVYKELDRGLFYKHEAWTNLDGTPIAAGAAAQPATQPRPQPQAQPAAQTVAPKPVDPRGQASASPAEDTTAPLKLLAQAYTDIGIKGDTEDSKALKLAWAKYITGLSSLGPSVFVGEKIKDVIRSLHTIRAEVPKQYWADLPEAMMTTIKMESDVKTLVEGFQLRAKEEAVKAKK